MNLAAAIESHTADAPAVLGGWGTMTWGAVREEAAAWRLGLAELGVDPGDRVGIVAAASPAFVLAYLAVLGIGAVAVPLNPASPPAEVATELAEVGARVVVGGPGSQDTLGALGPTAGVDHVAVPAGMAMPGAAVLGGSAVEGAPPPPVVPRKAEDLAVLVFTSGTAGAPKPAMLTHGNLLANLDQVRRVSRLALTPEDRCLGVPPLFHIFGLNMVLGMALVTGSAVVLLERFDPGAALAAATDHQVSVVVATPGVLEAWAGLGEATARDLASVRLVVSGAAALPPRVAERFSTRFGVPVWEGYGLTETSPTVAATPVRGRARPGDVGAPLPGVEVRVVDRDGSDVLVGDPGEVWVRGPNVFAGYWGHPEATARVLDGEGWLHTGDVAVVDEEGGLRIVDRIKDLIIVSGFNVYPAEVEQVLEDHPGVAEAAVIGVADERTGEAVSASVVPAPGASPTESDLVAHCARALASYKCPAQVRVVQALPRGPGDKVVRRLLR